MTKIMLLLAIVLSVFFVYDITEDDLDLTSEYPQTRYERCLANYGHQYHCAQYKGE